MRTAEFSFDLPPELIAQHPVANRDESRLLILNRACVQLAHRQFRDLLSLLKSGDVLVLNNSRVIPARLRGHNAQTGGIFEILLLEENTVNDWWVMIKPGKRARIGTRIDLRNRCGQPAEISAVVTGMNAEGHRRLEFTGNHNLLSLLDEIGEVPLPPYITRRAGTESIEDHQRYQTVFARPAGSVAAPTAGLHFTERLLDELRARGVQLEFVTLHVGPGTFAPVKAESLAAHVMHHERFEINDATALAVNAAKASGRRIIAVGTTTVRVLESVTRSHPHRLIAGPGRTNIFIYPPHPFHIVDALITNFHLPGSTLLMLVSAFAAPGAVQGREIILSAYAEAIRERYRFFSYGDAMFIQ